MNYYDVALPIKPNRLFTYKSESSIELGCRVIVSLNKIYYTGIVWNRKESPDRKIKYKSIIENIDDKPFIKDDLRKLAEWMSDYYRSSLGQVLTAILPVSFNIRIQQKIRKNSSEFPGDLSEDAVKLIKSLPEQEWKDIKDLKKELKLSGFYSLIEHLEEKELVEIKRISDRKQKKKLANFIVLKDYNGKIKLTSKQAEIYNIIKHKKSDVPLSEIAKLTSYSVVKALRNKKLIDIEVRELVENKIPVKIIPSKFKNVELNEEQNKVLKRITTNLEEKKFRVFLLHGVTGSGKTEVYIKAIKKVLKLNKTALMLVPEISLTPQMVNRFYSEFGEEIAILHSHLSNRNRWLQWQKIRKGKCRIVIGARSAIFAPLENPGIFIVDEEHENSYKQENNPRYNARDFAVIRAKEHNSTVILGSATPALESWFNSQNGKYERLELKNRPFSYPLPKIKLIDMKTSHHDNTNFSNKLKEAIIKRLKRKEQIILLQNRRGHSSFVQCINCGNLLDCPNCNISLKYHSRTGNLICHYCGYKELLPRKCPQCGSYRFNFGAPGTQQIEKEIRLLFPTAKVLRMDSDTVSGKGSYDSMYARMLANEIDILLGTQMIAKGLDFPNVTLVGVISADVSLNVPDFRASERTFQLITQVAGRSGRAEKPGEVIIQTYTPENYAIRFAIKKDFEGFAREELQYRKRLCYPPYYKIARLLYTSGSEEILKKEMNKIKNLVDKMRSRFLGEDIYFLGPVPAPLTKINKKFRFHLIIKAKKRVQLIRSLNILEMNSKLTKKINIAQDIDPLSLL